MDEVKGTRRMATAPPPGQHVGEARPTPSGDAAGTGLDAALRAAVVTIDSPEYQDGNAAFSPLTRRDWAIMVCLYVLIPVVFALVVGLP